MLIDFHIHAFPDKLAEKTIPMLSEIAGGATPSTNGTLADTLTKMDSWQVDMGVVMHIATRPGSQTKVNDWAAQIQNDRIHCFGSIHPDAEDAIEELRRMKAMGLKGVKLHPDYQKFMITEERLFPIYEEISKLGLPVTFHTGYDPLSPDLIHATAQGVAQIAERFPQMTIIAAHLGSMNGYDDAEKYVAGKNVYLDTALCSKFCSKEQMERIIKKHGSDKVLFASDCPWSTPVEEAALIASLSLSPQEKENIFFRNAQKLLQLA